MTIVRQPDEEGVEFPLVCRDRRIFDALLNGVPTYRSNPRLKNFAEPGKELRRERIRRHVRHELVERAESRLIPAYRVWPPPLYKAGFMDEIGKEFLQIGGQGGGRCGTPARAEALASARGWLSSEGRINSRGPE